MVVESRVGMPKILAPEIRAAIVSYPKTQMRVVRARVSKTDIIYHVSFDITIVPVQLTYIHRTYSKSILNLFYTLNPSYHDFYLF